MRTVTQDREACIGCTACAAIHPQGWEMKEDGKASIIGGKRREDGWEEQDIDETTFAHHKEAAESCPVHCIHLTNEKGERII